MLTPNVDIPNIPNTPEVATPLSSGPAQPVVMFPVRLETRFFPQMDGSSELRVRVYPDKVHIDSHEPELTADEQTWGQHFWAQTWRAGNDQARAKAVWQQLADRFDAPRAAWVARTLQPLNPEDRPAIPVATDRSLPKPVRFPSPTLKAEAWTRAPKTSVLPNFWVVLGYKSGRLVVNLRSRVIPDLLATGPDPNVIPPANSSDNDEGLGIDDGMKWLVNFDEAEKVGMGIRAKLTKEEAVQGFDFLLVMGIKDAPGASHLAELFNAHHYIDGLSCVPQGTPSNNTADAPSGFSSKDPGHEASYLAEHTSPPFQPGDGSNADVLTTAFGLANAGPVFTHLPKATAKEQMDSRQMNTALWQATWGYFLLQMLGVGKTPSENPLTDDDIAWIRSHFIDYVRASGPLPALRIGKQPYGILPVTSLNAWKPTTGQESMTNRDVTLRDFLLQLRDLWRRNYPEVPRLGRSDKIDQDLAEVLSMEGLSSSYSIRNLMGRHYLEHLWVFLSAEHFFSLPFPWQPVPRGQITALEFRKWFAAQINLTGAFLQTLGIMRLPRLAQAVFSPPGTKLRGVLVQGDQGLTLMPNYIESLLVARDIELIRNEPIQQSSQHTLLYMLLRHSMLLEYSDAASRLLIRRGLLQPELRREPELVDLQAGQVTQTAWEQLKTIISVAGVAEPMAIGKYLLGFIPTGEPDLAREPDLKSLSDFRDSLAHLKSLDVPRLEQLMTSTLDLCSHRLDAWITSLATKRLAEMRKASLTGVLFGGYGWVMNLKPTDAQTQVATSPGEQGPIFASANNPGFIHTPSLTQASTAAVLRSGHLAHTRNQPNSPLTINQPNSPLAIDLSSARVRLATWLLDGVRQGQPLGALLGYRFERRLQETGNAQFITFFRELAPLVARKLEQTNEAVENIAANNVVDGMKLNQLWRDVLKRPPESARPETDTGRVGVLFRALKNKPRLVDVLNAKGNLEAALNQIADAVDAVSDALMAESVYQVVRGNPVRAASTVESIAGGETPPPELEVVRTPRTGIALTHRLVTLFSGDPKLPREWALSGRSLRANAEPHLNAWVAKLLGNPANVRCVVERLEPGTGKVLESKELLLDRLLLAPLDFIYAVEGGQGGQQAEIEQRILYMMMLNPDGFAPGSLLRISPNRKPEWKSSDLGYGEFNELLRIARRLITSLRALNPSDLNLPERNTNFSVDVVELEKRAVSAEQMLLRTPTDFKANLARPDTANLDMLRQLILRSAGFGVAGAVPLSAGAAPSDRQIILTQVASIQKEVTQRVEQLKLLATTFNASTATAEDKRDYALARLRIIFGKAFIVLPRFTTENAVELEKALADSVKVQDGDPLTSITWFQRMARVRDGVSRLNAMLNYSEALQTGEKLKLTIAQLPYDTNDRWVGLPFKAGQTRLPGGKLSLVVQATTAIDVRQPLAGLLIDEWVEVVPSATETTGIALQYDQPNSAPPQTILIAVPPEIELPWTVWSLQQVLLETLDLARIRAVDSDSLNEVGHFLPALYFAFNTDGDTVSTDFTKIK
jgi:hypothetical protein